MHSQYSGTERANWSETYIVRSVLEDESSMLQLGQLEESVFDNVSFT